MPEGTQRGNLRDLLAAGMHDVRLLEGHVSVPVGRIPTRVGVEGRRVVVEVHGAREIR